MNNFDYYNPTHIVFGKERLAELDKLVPKNVKVLVLYGGGSVKKYGVLQKVLVGLGDRAVTEFGGIEPNPRFSTLMKAVEVVQNGKIDFLLAVGGGSVMDGTKFVALASEVKQENALELLMKGFRNPSIKQAKPFGTVVTLPATGSEMNSGGVITYDKGKYPFGNQLVYPKFSILDPTLTFTLPATQVANGVVDAFIHVTEQYLTFPTDSGFQDRTAEGILKTLIEIGRKTIDEPTDYDARANLMWCATMALNGLIGAGVPQDWSTHMIGHELTAMFGIDHAKTLAIIAPAVWTTLKEQKHKKLLQYAERVWHLTSGDDNSRIDAAISKTREFFESLDVRTRLTDYNIASEKIDDLVKALEKHGLTKLSETRAVTLDISRKIMETAL